MKVIMQTSWAGQHFSLVPGDLVLMPDDLAKARLALGHVRPPTADELRDLELRLFPGIVAPAVQSQQPPVRRTKEKRHARPRQ